MANDCKYQRKQYQISYDSGNTWHNAVPARYEKGELTEYSSPDCSGIEVQYRWRELEGQYICIDNNKYTKEIREESYDNGATWYVSYPTVYKEGYFVEYNEEFCSYKFRGHYYVIDNPSSSGGHSCPIGWYWNGYGCVRRHVGLGGFDPLKVLKCDGTSALTKSDVTYYIDYYPIFSAEIGSCVKSLDASIFSGATQLSSCTFSDNSELTTIGSNVFRGCTALTNIVIPDSVTSIGEAAFYCCSGLTSISIPIVITIGTSAFYDCSSLTNITLGNNLLGIGGDAFGGCSSLTSITIPDSTTFIGVGSFSSCSGLTNISIGDGVSNIRGYTFDNCGTIETLTIGSGITSIENYAFNESTINNLYIYATTPPTLGKYNPFGGLYHIYVPCESVDAYKTAPEWIYRASIIRGMDSCAQYKWEKAGVTDYACVGVDKHYVEYYMVSYDNGSTWEKVSPTSSRTSSDVIEYNSYDCGGTNFKYIAEYLDNKSNVVGCSVGSANTLTINDIRTSSFQYSAMTSIIIGDCVTSIGSFAMSDCSSLSSVTLSNNITTIEQRVFSNCSSLTSVGGIGSGASVEIPSGVTTIGKYCFDHCNGLTSVTIPDNVVSIGEDAFWKCYSLSSVTLGNGITTIENFTFSDCISLTGVTIPNTVTQIGNSAFNGCSGLTNVTIPNSVESIVDSAFESCSGLTSCTIGSGVTSIGNYAFRRCVNLTSITVLATTPPTLGGSNVFQYTNDCPIYVPSASVNAYKTASVWSNYASRIQAIS